MKKHFSFYLIVSIFLVVSCKKENPSLHDTLPDTPNSLSNGVAINNKILDETSEWYENSENPYDYLGQIHNDGLEEIRHAIQNSECNSEYMNERMRYLSYNVAFANGLGSEQANFILDKIDSLGTLTIDTNYIIERIESSTLLSSNAQNYVKDVMRVTFNYSDTPETDVQTKIERLKLIEQGVLSDLSLTTTELETILGGTSIARYSAYYHYTHYQNWQHGNNPPMNGFPLVGGLGAGFCDWLAYMYLRDSEVNVIDASAGAIALSAISAYVIWGF